TVGTSAREVQPLVLELVKSEAAQAGHHEPLAPMEEELLVRCEAQMRQSLYGFLKMGSALLTIKNQRLYRKAHATFDDYCRERWQIGRAYAYRLMAAAEVVANLSTPGDIAPPQMEAQVRPLIGLDRSVAVQVWQRVAAESKGKPITSTM